MVLKSQPRRTGRLLVSPGAGCGSPRTTVVAVVGDCLPPRNCRYEFSTCNTPAPYRASSGEVELLVHPGGFSAPLSSSALIVRESVAAEAVPAPPSPWAPACTNKVAPPATSGVE